MTRSAQSKRALKREVLNIISSDNWEEKLDDLLELPAMQVTNALIASLCDTDEEIKWRVITSIGITVSRLADDDVESARTIMRRLMWSLNSESGGIGWGAPEAMAEIMSVHSVLAKEFAQILVSYAVHEGDNFLELPALQRGVLWGLGRFSQTRPELMQDVPSELSFFIMSDDAAVRGLAAWVAGIMKARELSGDIEKLLHDDTEIHLYIDRALRKRKVRDIAHEALAHMEAG